MGTASGVAVLIGELADPVLGAVLAHHVEARSKSTKMERPVALMGRALAPALKALPVPPGPSD